MKKLILPILFGIMLLAFGMQVMGSPEQPNDNPVGYEYLDNSQVLHIWNTVDDYYFNSTNGMQFSNHYQEYWSKNIFCGGLDGLNLYCTDTLDFLNWTAITDNETYVNYTGTKTFGVGLHSVTLELIYHLGVNDTSITVQPKITKDSPATIEKDILFIWRIEDIKSGNTKEDDVIYVENRTLSQFDVYNLSDNINVTYTNSSQYVIDDLNGLGSIKLNWNPEEVETLTIQSEQGQFNAPITLTVNLGEFLQNVVTTKFFWIDAECTVFCIDPDDEVTGVSISCPSGCNWGVGTGDDVGCMAESIIGTCSLSNGCFIEWQDKTSGSYTKIPASDTDVDCSGVNCRKTGPDDNTWHYKNVDCEGEGQQKLRCTLNINPTAVSGTPTLTCTVANETQGRTAIEEGINNKIPNSTRYEDQQIYVVDENGVQNVGRFDKVAALDNQTWAFNYVTSGEEFTNMTGIKTTVNVWENQTLGYEAIVSQVETFIDETKA